MSKINHNRPRFAKQKIWERYDSLLPYAKRPNTPARSGRRSKPASSKPLYVFLWSYQGDDPHLQACKAKVERGETLTPSEAGKAGHLMQRLEPH